MRTCAQYDVDPLAYLAAVFRHLAAGAHTERLDELLPMHWQSPAPDRTPA